MILITPKETLHLTKTELAIHQLPEIPYVVITNDYIHFIGKSGTTIQPKISDTVIPQTVYDFLTTEHDNLLIEKMEQYT